MSRFTRIILIGDDDQGLREFTISHRMVWLLGVLGLLLAAALAYVFVTYGGLLRAADRSERLETELTTARAQLAGVDTLRAELASMAAMQQQLLFMLGIEDGAASDSLASEAGGALADLAGAVIATPPDAWPTTGYVTREFAAGQTNEGVRPHPGLDIAGPEGAPILAAGDGLVVRLGDDPFLGKFVEIQHGMGYLTVYGHCRQIAVSRGAQVRRGQVVAYMGATGEASAPHLHFEVWQNGMAVDPRRFLTGEPPPQ